MLVFRSLDTRDQSEQQVHDSRGGQVLEQQLGELWLGLDVLDHLQTRVLIAVPVLDKKDNITTRARVQTRQLLTSYLFRTTSN